MTIPELQLLIEKTLETSSHRLDLLEDAHRTNLVLQERTRGALAEIRDKQNEIQCQIANLQSDYDSEKAKQKTAWIKVAEVAITSAITTIGTLSLAIATGMLELLKNALHT